MTIGKRKKISMPHRDASCMTVQFINRGLTISGDAVLEPTCWGLCGDCLEPNTDEWVLTWSDEFDGDELDTDNWSYEYGNNGWGNNELQNYTSHEANIEVSSGTLKINALSDGNGNYSSSRIITNNKVEFQYGKIEARIKKPVGQGVWPAFWMLGANWESVGWPQCGEIDIMEHVNNEPLTHSTMHWNDGGHNYQGSHAPVQLNEWHIYGAIWDATGIKFTLNDQPMYFFPFEANNNTADIFQNPFFFILNVAVGGNWPGNPDGTAQFPATMEVDYIRVSNQTALAIDDGDEPETVRIFPVPASDQVTIDFGKAEARSIRVYNLVGQEVYNARSVGSTFKIDTSNWNSGVYILSSTDDSGRSSSHRLVVNGEGR